ncbi:hypothetical protein [uncultured Cohaesibacter sp.]|uniref:hypothetical protein n=1 Tax=uncultured Cohaesibacter sp. TaxID=1002546 RepID=UPI0029C7AA87|nr:hypothetical protein [uncultured Cohaesibacter sp.]
MSKIVRRETRKRGFFGWVFFLLFIGFNAIMLLWFVLGMNAVSEMKTASSAEEAGKAIGTAVGVGMILFVWVVGAVITGLFALLTRGRKSIIEEVVE